MATRGGPAFRLQGNPLGGMLRDLDRRTRRPTKGRRKVPVEPKEGPRGPRGPAGPPGGPAGAADVVETGPDGRARWEWPVPFAQAPVVTAVAVGEDPMTVVLEEAEPTHAVLRVWFDAAEPVGPGVPVHVTACPRYPAT
ncbi:hypothetical protein [Streptomyces parvulus]|uniref:hypothetical protein n=1 Tax=Streptomyces parvulus TaxID=146923 RepID=UPI0038028C7E